MKQVLVLLMVACIAVASATEVVADTDAEAEVDESNMDVADFDNAPFVPQSSEHDEVEVDDADEESVVSDEESDVSDELEGNTEFEMEDVETAFVEADAHAAAELEAETETETETEADAERRKSSAKGKAKGGARKMKAKIRGGARKSRGGKARGGRGGKKFTPRMKPRFPTKPRKEFKYHSERHGKIEDPEMAKLNLALEAVKEDILSTNKQINTERQWVVAVAKIIAQYNEKMKRVEAHIIALRKEMKSLYRKKKQIENLKLQRALQDKLKQARGELKNLTGSLTKVQKKKGQLNKSGADLRVTIAGLQGQLAKLRGQKLFKPKAAPKKCGKGKRYSKRAGKCVPKGKGKKSKKANKSL